MAPFATRLVGFPLSDLFRLARLERVVIGLEIDPQRRALQVERRPEYVFQVTLVVLGYTFQMGAMHDDDGWIAAPLMGIFRFRSK